MNEVSAGARGTWIDACAVFRTRRAAICPRSRDRVSAVEYAVVVGIVMDVEVVIACRNRPGDLYRD